MTNSCLPDRNSKFPHPKKGWLFILSRGGMTLGGILLVGFVGGVWRLQTFVHQELKPLAEKNLTTALNRPVQLGKVENISLLGVQFGASVIPATPTDPDRVTVKTVNVGFDLLQLLLKRKLKLDVTLVNPDVYIEQDQQGQWVSLQLATPSQQGSIQTDLETIRFRNAQLVLVPQPRDKATKSPVTFLQVNGKAEFSQNRLASFEAGGQSSNDGNVYLQGEGRPQIQGCQGELACFVSTLQLQGQNLPAEVITNLIRLPLALQAGRVQGHLKIALQPQKLPLLYGNAYVQDVQLKIPRLPQTFANSQGSLRFQGNEIYLEKIATRYGKIPLSVRGSLNNQEYQLVARASAVNVADAQETLNIKLPVVVSGEVQADLRLNGAIAQPRLVGIVAATKPVKIDKVDFTSASAQFDLLGQNSLLTFKNIRGKATVGGEIAGGGTIQLGPTPVLDFRLTANNVPGDAIAKVYDFAPGFQIGNLSGTAQLTGIAGNVQTRVRWQAPQATYPGIGETLIEPDKTVKFRNVAIALAGGQVQAFGSWSDQRWQAVADASQIQVKRFVNHNQIANISLDDALFNGRLIFSGTSGPFKMDSIRPDNAKVQVAGGTVAISSLQLAEQNFSTQLVADGVQLGQLLKQVHPAMRGPLAGTFQVSGRTDNLSPKTLRATGNARLAVGNGTVNVTDIQLANGVYQTQLQAQNVDVRKIAQLPQQFQGKLSGDLDVAGTIDSFDLQAIQAKGTAQLKVGNGTINATDVQLAKGNYQAQLYANNVPLSRLTQVPPQFQGLLAGQLNVAGSVTSFQPKDIQATGQARVSLAGGKVIARNIRLANGQYQAVVDASGVQLRKLHKQLRGRFGGQVQLVGKVVQIQDLASLGNLRAGGKVSFSQGLAGLQQPLTAAFNWDGQKLFIEQASSPDLQAKGYIATRTKGLVIPEITELNLNVQAKNYNLQELPLQLPSTLALAGKVDFNGQVTGQLPLPNIQGQVKLRNLVVSQLPFESVLSGQIQSLPEQGLNLQVAGTRDRIALKLNANQRPQDFLVQWQQATAIGQSLGDNLIVKVDRFPLAVLNLKPPADIRLGISPVTGLLNGNFQVNQRTLAATGDVAIAQPQVGQIKGDQFYAQFNYGNGQAEITNSELVKGESRYALVGNLTQTKQGPRIQGKLNITQGQIQDILGTLQVFELQDFQRGLAEPTYGRAADLAGTQPVGVLEKPVLTQLQRFAEVQALQAKQRQQRRDATPIPEIADLKGTINGEVSLDTAAQNGLAVKFNLKGQNFAWGREDDPARLWKAQFVLAQGSLENGVLRLLPLRIESKDRLIAFNGYIGNKDQSGQLRVQNFPLQTLHNIIKLPVGLAGNLNATATLAGSIANPKARGEMRITEGTLNQKGVESATASFSYDKGRLNFGSNVKISDSEPVNITGSLPYQLPFASVAPDSNLINLDVKVKDGGLSVLNLLTNQVAFESGEGQIDLKVRGTPQQPVLEGLATVNNASFSAPALPEKLTNVVGQLKFDFDRIVVDNLQGQFSRGRVEAQGEIPIANNVQTQIDNPLSVSLKDLAVNLKGLYQGGVSGNLQIEGSALNPLIGGQLQLANGRVLLAESTANNTSSGFDKIDITRLKQVKPESLPTTDTSTTLFNNLQLTLGNNVTITRPPILSFRATGTLAVNGSIKEAIPEGTIRLREGSVNLFTTQLKLAPGYKHKATFRANQPRDPELDIQLFARVLDAIQTVDLSDEIPTGLGSLETVRVEASIQGQASKLDENLELTSSPIRSETEIVALLGGGFLDPEGQNDNSGLINIAGIAGSAVLNNFQEPFNQLATSLGLTELRFFPTIISNSSSEDAETSFSSLELAAEAGVDVSRRISVSSLKILTTNDLPQWGVNYRFSDAIRIRAATNFQDDTRAVVEFRQKF